MQLLNAKLMPIGIICGILLLIMTLSQSAYAGGECASLGGACDNSGWSGAAKLDEIGNTAASQETATATKWPAKSRTMRWNISESTQTDTTAEETATQTTKANTTEDTTSESARNVTIKKPVDEPSVITRSDDAKAIVMPLEDVSDSDILLDVSENSSTHIVGSVVIPYMQFDDQPGILKPREKIARILGDSGISQNDSVVIYGECLPCGGGPSVATYIYWMMLGLGHEKVKLLDATADDWAESGRNITTDAEILPARVYTPQNSSDYTATYEMVKGGQAQIVDARTIEEFGQGSIPGSVSIPYASVLDGDRIKSEDKLNRVFMMLDRDRPVVVFTNTGMKASVVWFSLKMMGYDALLYSYQDWMSHQSS